MVSKREVRRGIRRGIRKETMREVREMAENWCSVNGYHGINEVIGAISVMVDKERDQKKKEEMKELLADQGFRDYLDWWLS